MKIIEVTISNFRQYHGTSTIELSTDPERNITIIQGVNGSGKSNFMNAITWCLYNEEIFKSKTNQGRDVINESALFDSPAGEAETSVTVAVGDRAPEFIFKRIEKYRLEKGMPYRADVSFSCQQIDPNKGWIRREDPAGVVERVFINSALKNFFFFDGEQMDRYFEDTVKIKKNVEQIAQIGLIDQVLNTLSDVEASIKKEIKTVSSKRPDVDIEPEDVMEEIQTLKGRKTTLDSEIKTLDDRIAQIEEYLKTNSDTVVSELQIRRDELEKERTAKVKDLDLNKKSLKDLVSKYVSRVYAYGALLHTKNIIDEGTKKGQLPPNIKEIFIRELLETGICICGRDLKDDEESRKHVEALLDKVVPNSIVEEAETGKYVVGELIDKFSFTSEYAHYQRKIRELDGQLSEIRENLESISNRLANYDVDIIATKEGELKSLKDDRDKKVKQISTIEYRIDELNAKMEDFDEYYKKIQEVDSEVKALNKLNDYSNLIGNDIVDIRDSIVEEVRKNLELQTKQYFFQMIWKGKVWSDVRIIDEGPRYRISLLSDHGQEALGDQSAGEKEVLALSFTAALYNSSGISAPIFIDTPLGKISGPTRMNIAELLKTYLNQTQLIILPTDTEYTEEVRQCLLPKVGAEYRIKYDPELRQSKVVEYD